MVYFSNKGIAKLEPNSIFCGQPPHDRFLKSNFNLVYFDSSVIRTLIEQPEIKITLLDDFCRNIKRWYQSIESYYLFFEYIGFHKDKLEKT